VSDWLKRWQALAPREQWLAYAVGLALLPMLYLLLIGDPLAGRIKAQDNQRRLAEARRLEAESAMQEMRAKLAADPNLGYRKALQTADAERQQTLGLIEEQTSALVSPQRMKILLQDLLRTQPGLRLLALESSSSPLMLPEAPGPAAPATNTTGKAQEPPPPPLTLYRHGLRLTLEGGYFELLAYLRAIQSSGWRLHWDSLDYRVGETGPGRAKIVLELHTLSRHAGWVGV
jgi:MSHA biogenesis protein MshJ